MHEDIEKILVSQEEIKKRVKELGEEISRDYKDKFPLFVCILRGAFVFLADLVREVHVPISVDFMAISSYGGKTESSGQVKILKDLDTPIEDRHVLIVEDIVDTGLTMDAVTRLLKTRKPKSIKICTLLDKVDRRIINIKVDYYGFRIPNSFVVGYGLDYEEKYRNLPYIGILKEKVYKGGSNN
ncbi:hypoxanthine phosphoribosyltransferase [Caldisericum exile]|uniref:Hypoxanthine phosphoribosyltransferase n=1 Tax=Caldisericum exile (strain DSM 21853 / NBRC 104410 / AZM16c01) TaxID=511051 RepID=A0A7U6JG44_CALEA|nr:hypoxanthine phosphoribosyltransferase [Caldisericum exile]BAL80990.1 hypoxanthine-guanine phosphoribosyltransferase [Caldisericum exile AZM16c01]